MLSQFSAAVKTNKSNKGNSKNPTNVVKRPSNYSCVKVIVINSNKVVNNQSEIELCKEHDLSKQWRSFT